MISQTKNSPKISVVMAVYNGENFLIDSVDSILTQTFRDFEFIIIDDGSTDRTPFLIESLKDPRIRKFRHGNRGLTKSLNRGISHAKSEIIARQDVDDRSLPERLERQLQALESDPTLGLIGTSLIRFDGSTLRSNKHVPPLCDQELRRRMMRGGVGIYHSAAMFRREINGIDFRYDEDLVQGQDYGLWVEIARNCKIANLEEILHLGFRNRPSSITNSRKILTSIKVRRNFARLAIQHLGGSSGDRFVLSYNLTKSFAKMLTMAVFRKCISKNYPDERIALTEYNQLYKKLCRNNFI